jgi:hypothetical protein
LDRQDDEKTICVQMFRHKNDYPRDIGEGSGSVKASVVDMLVSITVLPPILEVSDSEVCTVVESIAAFI